MLAKKGYEQLGKKALPPNDGNLFDPASGGEQAAHGRFDAQAKSRQDIYTSRQADAVASGLLLVGVAGLLMLATSPLVVGPMITIRALRRIALR